MPTKAQLIAQIAERDAEIAALRKQLDDILTPKIKKMTVEDGEVKLDLDLAHNLVGMIGRQLRDVVDAEGGPNYAELYFKEAGTFKPVVVAVARSAEQTPHALRMKAEAEVERLRKVLVEHGIEV